MEILHLNPSMQVVRPNSVIPNLVSLMRSHLTTEKHDHLTSFHLSFAVAIVSANWSIKCYNFWIGTIVWILYYKRDPFIFQ